MEIEISVELPDLKETWDYQLIEGKWLNKESGQVVETQWIPQRIDAVEDIQWYWVDVFVTFSCEKRNNPFNLGESGYQLVTWVLQQVEEWVR